MNEGKPHWHAQAVSRNKDRASRRSPYGPITRRWEVAHWKAYRTKRDAERVVPLSSNTIVRCTDPICAPSATDAETG